MNTVQRFGKICVIDNHATIMNKVKNHQKYCIWLGFTENDASKCYQLLNLETNQIVLFRDVTILNKSYSDWANVKKPSIVLVATEEICTFDECDEIDVPDPIPSDHGTEHESNSDDDRSNMKRAWSLWPYMWMIT